eukprot:GHVL01020192.1.p1 GENE.GHVL01020192.1~~GHVL01020192.1.p1  ORF type:complete len:875 (+),score=145.10 GHVL01020192.1:227-2851(+)
MVLPGVKLENVKKVMSHYQALAQCDDFIRRNGLKPLSEFDTAGSAQIIKEESLTDSAAIASELAAETFGLTILHKNIQETDFNFTRFLLITKKNVEFDEGYQMKTSINLWVPHTAGSLFKVMSAVAVRDLNLTKIESRPAPWGYVQQLQIDDNPVKPPFGNEKFSYIFYLDIIADEKSSSFINLMRHLKEITSFVRILGCYPEGSQCPSICRDALKSALLIKTEIPESVKDETLRIGIYGFGKFGQFLSKTFIHFGYRVMCSSRSDYTYRAAQLNCEWMQARNLIKNVDVLVICSSILSFTSVLDGLDMNLLKSEKLLVVDVLSVKTFPKNELIKRIPQECDILCTHPLFGPDSGKYGWQGLPFQYEIVRCKNEKRSKNFLNIFKMAGCRMMEMSCEEHDKVAAGTQFITHLIGRILAYQKLKPTRIDTNGYKVLQLLMNNTISDSFELFKGIYQFNPCSNDQLKLFRNALIDVTRQLHFEDKFNPITYLIKPSKTSTILGLVKGLEAKNEEVFSLCVGEPDFDPPREVIDATISAVSNGETKYTEIGGRAVLKQTICDHYKKSHNLSYTPNQVVISNGAKQSIYQAVMCLCQEGDEVIIHAPYWVSYIDIVKMSGATPIILDTQFTDGYILRAKLLSTVITHRTRMVIICNPSNPCGTVIPVTELHMIAKLLSNHTSVYVLADEIYDRYIYDAEHVPLASIPSISERTITINGFSKTFSMTGFRIGYLIAPTLEIARLVLTVQGQITGCCCSLSQAAGIAALTKVPQSWFDERRIELREKRDLMSGLMRSLIPQCPFNLPQGAFYILADISSLLSPKVPSAEDFSRELLSNTNVAIVPGEDFGAANSIRLSFATSKKIIENSIIKMASFINKI